MKEEILAAVMFLVRFIEKSETFPRDQLENFKNNLTSLLIQRFEKHWFPEVPTKGQGYRCIRVNGVNPIDMTLEKAAVSCGLSYSDLRLPTELTVWVDPNEVCYRLGESEGSYCTLATFNTTTKTMEMQMMKKGGYFKSYHHQNQNRLPYIHHYRSSNNTLTGAPTTLNIRTKNTSTLSSGGLSPRQNQHYSSQWRNCDRQQQATFNTAPYHMNPNRSYMPHHRSAYKNMLSV